MVRRLLDDGFDVVVSARRQPGDSPDSVRSEFIRADVTDPESVDALRREAGAVDVLVHLVGSFSGGTPVAETPVRTWDDMIERNLRSAFLCARAFLPGMLDRDWGRVVFVSSRSARRGRSGNAAYSVAKSGLGVLAEAIAEETRETNVTANVVAPSTIDTPDNRKGRPGADHGRWVSPETVAAAISWLASDPAGELRGAWLPVYGGV